MRNVCMLIVSALLLGVCGMGQNSAPEPANGPVAAPLPPNIFFRTQNLGDKFTTTYFSVAENGKLVTGAPYTATATTESTQALADGNRIVNKTTARLARDSQGRTRREESMGSLGPLAVKAPKTVFINDPVAKTAYILDLNDATATQLPKVTGAAGEGAMTKQIVIGTGGLRSGVATATTRVDKRVIMSGGPEAGVEQRIVVLGGEDGQTKTESLGTQVIEGVSAEGKRVTRTIAAGEIGNERPLDITSEVWFSPDLQIVVLSKRNDPRFGETVYRLTDIKRVEPDPALFQVPGNFTINSPDKAKPR